MTSRVYVHVGSRKTGTSFLQRTVYRSREAVSEQGVQLPVVDRAALNAMVEELVALPDDEPVGRRLEQALQDLRTASTGLGDATGLVTHERLAQATRRQAGLLLDALADVEVHLVLTARDWGRQIPSEWQEQIKQRMELGFAEFAEAVRRREPGRGELFWRRQDVVDILDRWGARLPREQIHVVPVPPPGAPRELLLQRLCGLLGLDPDRLRQVTAYNPSLGAEQAEMLRRLNITLGDRLTDIRGEYNPVIREGITRHVLKAQQGTRLVLPPALLPWCQGQAQSAVATLGAEVSTSWVTWTRLVPSATAGEDAIAPAVTDTDVATTAVETLTMVAVRNHEERERLERRIERLQARRGASPPKRATRPRLNSPWSWLGRSDRRSD